ncbi:MAG: hypothetical protein A2Y95_06245 [Deltaproteobacteria bacterium RBG_13_65_10]|nr:MAG: hypothetical protein A2Y95_06245 [Deltaproteobacteria bacterium RBG_13_65_10]
MPKSPSIPVPVATSAVERLRDALAKLGRRDLASSLLFEAKRGYISSTTIPLGRLRFMGAAERWGYQLYRNSDEYWDHCAPEGGTPEDLMLSMIVERLC